MRTDSEIQVTCFVVLERWLNSCESCPPFSTLIPLDRWINSRQEHVKSFSALSHWISVMWKAKEDLCLLCEPSISVHKILFLISLAYHPTGETVLPSEEPITYSLHDDKLSRYCSMCLKQAKGKENLHRCSRCQYPWYCSKPCQVHLSLRFIALIMSEKSLERPQERM